MTPARRRLSWAALLFLLFWVALPAFSAEGAAEDVTSGTVGWVFRWLNFALVFGGGGYLIAKKAPALFRARADAVGVAIQEAARAREAAERRLREAEEKLKQLEQELAALRAAAQRESAAEAERIRALAREESKKIELAARAEVEAAERAARMELKAMAARLAVARAEALLRQQMTPQVETAIFRSFLSDLERSAN